MTLPNQPASIEEALRWLPNGSTYEVPERLSAIATAVAHAVGRTLKREYHITHSDKQTILITRVK